MAFCLMQVQGSWAYLENIYGGSEDIRRQLPADTALFDGVHATFKQAMASIHASRANAVQVAAFPAPFAVCLLRLLLSPQMYNVCRRALKMGCSGP